MLLKFAQLLPIGLITLVVAVVGVLGVVASVVDVVEGDSVEASMAWLSRRLVEDTDRASSESTLILLYDEAEGDAGTDEVKDILRMLLSRYSLSKSDIRLNSSSSVKLLFEFSLLKGVIVSMG